MKAHADTAVALPEGRTGSREAAIPGDAATDERVRVFRKVGVVFLCSLAFALVIDTLQTSLGLFDSSLRTAPIFLVFWLAPLTAFGIAYRRSPAFRDTVLSLDFRTLTFFHLVRMVGGVFIVLWSQGKLPALFAFWAGGIDIVMGLTAPLMAFWAMSHRPFPRRLFIGWNVLGLSDFAVAFPIGLLYTSGVLAGSVDPLIRSLPVMFIPTFGVPLSIIMHTISLLQLRTERQPWAAPMFATPRTA